MIKIELEHFLDNNSSSSNLIKHGFELVGFKEFERGPRNIYLKEF